ncbi:hypothetical protein AYO44_13700 [Planctomycetaceae bacterium SCGC AG-212-F19]|nr:hypothetical protein AYO44_13700 [Planctomycetaceae bacterium SCGC AG-212-F19]
MTISSTAVLLNTLHSLQLLEENQFAQLHRYQYFASADPRTLAQQLVRCGWLTPYQINQLFTGHGAELALGSYLLLERIGEGAMGQVYKARHRTLGRLVALKVLRKELMANPAVVKRFHREVRAVAQVTHPNIVQAFDADQAGDLHFLAMEYVEGTDLAELVHQDGPMPVAAACEALRQAAVGLEYAHRLGLVHRDIKPSNLILAKAKGSSSLGVAGGVVKILDLGLARLQEFAHPRSASFLNQDAGSGSGTPLTQSGNVIGTPDFMAPEQARNSHLVDGRADLYSLGCTLYAILAECVPFPGGTALEKLFRHQEEQPIPLNKYRPDVPTAVVAVVRKLMAKRPDDRFQTAGEAAAALATLLPRRAPKAAGKQPEKGVRTTMVDRPPARVATAVANPAAPARPRPAPPTAKSRWSWRTLGVAGSFLVVGLSVLAYLVTRTLLIRP